MRYIISSLLLLIGSYALVAQSEVDALRYSFLRHGGTARYSGMSGAFGALGSDFSSLSTNPAGISTFKKSVKFMLSPGFSTNVSTANYRNSKTEDDDISVTLNNIGAVFEIDPGDPESNKWQNICVGIGYNRLLDLNEKATIKGYSEESSMLDQFALNSDGHTPDDLFDQYKEIEYLAWETMLTSVLDGSDNIYGHPYLDTRYLNQEKKYRNNGGIGELVFSIGGNYANKLQVGVTLGIHILRFNSVSKYTESSESTDLSSYTFGEDISTTGAGYNLKLGIIYSPVRFIRLGLAFHTPTFYQLKDVYSYTMQSYWHTPDSAGNTTYFYDTEAFNDNGTTENEFTYELFTPYRFIASTAFVISRFGLLSADYEYVDYSTARLRAMEDNFTEQNNNIKDMYNASHNFRVGAEVRLAPLYFRAGASYYGSPHSMTVNAKGSVTSYSAGMGIKGNKFYMDIAFNHSEYAKDYKLFDYLKFLDNGEEEIAEEIAELNFKQNYISITCGMRF